MECPMSLYNPVTTSGCGRRREIESSLPFRRRVPTFRQGPTAVVVAVGKASVAGVVDVSGGAGATVNATGDVREATDAHDRAGPMIGRGGDHPCTRDRADVALPIEQPSAPATVASLRSATYRNTAGAADRHETPCVPARRVTDSS
jgi:hypothetical protein